MRDRRPRHLPDSTGTLYLARASQVALWTHELTSQISDGMWENAGPWEHCRFWCRLNACLLPASAGEPRVETDHGYLCSRDRYGFSSLYSVKIEGRYVILDRMVNLGRLALACELVGHACGYEQHAASEDMPPTWDEWLERRNTCPAAFERHHLAVPPALADAYYSHPACKAYDVRQMKADVKAIKAAMKNRHPVCAAPVSWGPCGECGSERGHLGRCSRNEDPDAQVQPTS